MRRGPNGNALLRARALELHRQGLDVATIAQRLGCDRSTVHKWLRDPPAPPPPASEAAP